MDELKGNEEPSLYSHIYTIVGMIPSGKVTTYGRVAALVRQITRKGCTPRMVGYALAALKKTALQEDVPWQRVINAQGKISVHGDGWGNALQRELLEAEGVAFDDEGRVDFDVYEWLGPDEQLNI